MSKQTTWYAEMKDKKVFIVQIGSHRGNESVCGAVYLSESSARTEVKRLNEANSQTRAYYIARVVGQ